MKTSSVMRSSTLYLSDVMPLVVSEDGADGEIIAWADARPVVYKIVTEAKSAAFGRQSTQWHGWAQGENTPRAILHRLGVFRRMLDEFPEDCPASVFSWAARFTLEHYGRGLSGGHFTQWDGTYRRGSMTLDYTVETLDAVVARFQAWCGGHYPMKAVLLQGPGAKKSERVVWGKKDS